MQVQKDEMLSGSDPSKQKMRLVFTPTQPVTFHQHFEVGGNQSQNNMNWKFGDSLSYFALYSTPRISNF